MTANLVLPERVSLSILSVVGQVVLAIVAHDFHFLLVKVDGLARVQRHVGHVASQGRLADGVEVGPWSLSGLHAVEEVSPVIGLLRSC